MNRKHDCDCESLQDRVDMLQRQQNEREEREEENRQRQRREREQESREALRTASDWPEAFRKQRVLIAPELRMAQKTLGEVEADTRYDSPEDKERDMTFWREDVEGLTTDLEAIAVAEKVYAEEMAKVQEQIAALKAGVRKTVAQRLREKYAGKTSYDFTGELIGRLESDDISGWLNW